MSYATLKDVQDRMPQFVLTETSKPSSVTVQIFLDDVHAEYNSAMENLGYRIPITGAKALLQAKADVAQGAIARALYARAAAVGGEAAVASADRAQKLYDAQLVAYANGKNPKELTDAARTDDALPKPMTTVDGLLLDEDGDTIEPRARMDQRF